MQPALALRDSITVSTKEGIMSSNPVQYEAHIYSSLPPDGKSQLRIIQGCRAIVRYLFLMNVEHCMGCHCEKPTFDFLEAKNSQARLLKQNTIIQGACCMVLYELEREGVIAQEWNRRNE